LRAQIAYAKRGIAEDGKGQYKMEVLFGAEVSGVVRIFLQRPFLSTTLLDMLSTLIQYRSTPEES
jgi:hypothetical protein